MLSWMQAPSVDSNLRLQLTQIRRSIRRMTPILGLNCVPSLLLNLSDEVKNEWWLNVGGESVC